MTSIAHHSLKYASHYKGLFILLLSFALLDIFLGVLTPWPLKVIVDSVLGKQALPVFVGWIEYLPGGNESKSLLLWLVLSIFILFIIRQTLKMASRYLQVGVMTRVKTDAAADVFRHLQNLSMKYHAGHKAGDLVRRVVNDTDFVKVFLSNVFLPGFISVGTLVAMFTIMWHMQPSMSTIALATALPLPALIKYLTPKLSEQAYIHHEAEGELMAVAEQAITSLPVIQAFGRESHEDKRFKNVSLEVIRTNLRSTHTQLKFSVSVGTVTALGTAAMMVLGGIKVLEGELTVGSLLVFLAYLASTYRPMEELSNLAAAYAAAKGQAKRVFAVLDSDEIIEERVNALQNVNGKDRKGLSITFENVTFGYRPDTSVLTDINMSAPEGSIVALVGVTGAGKSTLVSLIPRFFDPWEGRVLLNGIDVRDVKVDELREKIAMVLQDSFLLPMSVAENIAYAKPDADNREIVAAAEAANAAEFISNLPKGYETVVGERGITLSGGQRQRISIARAFLKNSPVLILDEPTSALDSDSEAMILRSIEKLVHTRTTFTIAHRLSTIKSADVVFVLEKGRIVEAGSHDELLALRGHYKSMIEHQKY